MASGIEPEGRMINSHREPRRAPGAHQGGAPGAPGLPAGAAVRARAAALAALAILGVLASAALATGCGQERGGQAAGTAAKPPEPATGGALPAACELLTPGDVAGVTKEVSGSLSSTLEDAVGKDPSQCSYPVSADVPPRVISLAVRRFASPDRAASQQQAAEEGLRAMVTGAQVQDLPHLGDGAFWAGGQIDQLNVRRGDTLLSFTVQLDKDPLDAARRLADKALGRLAARTAPGGPQPGTKP
jgi:hypothetical protein